MLSKFVRCAVITSILTLPTVSLLPHKALADKTNFWVYNNTNANITELHVSESTKKSWEANILGTNQVVSSGDRLQVNFSNPSPNACLYDIWAVFSDGLVIEDYQVNVCDTRGYTFHDD